jgi:ubiquinone/menaquinone biosynthesis C-methylase UbiE
MEHDEEYLRLETKTKPEPVREQALFAGITPGMRVLDVGCGSGKTTSVLHALVQPRGTVLGVDISDKRIDYAHQHYGTQGVQFVCKDICEPLDGLGSFDFVWVRFILEYFKVEARWIVENVARVLKPGGILCLIDLDHNCMNHFEMPTRLETTMRELLEVLEAKANFDPYAGRKLYSYLHRLDFMDIRASVGAHHLIYHQLNNVDAYNWLRKIEVGVKTIGFDFRRYRKGYEEFIEEFMTFFNDPGRFTYTPLISVCGRRNDL